MALDDSHPEPLAVGQTAERRFDVTDARVRAFAEVSGDINPVHLDEAYAAKTIFRGRVAHGMLLGGFVSAVMANQLPGPGSIYLGQTLDFLLPVRIGETVTVRVTVTAIEGPRATLETLCLVGDKLVARGEALAAPPRRRKAGRA